MSETTRTKSRRPKRPDLAAPTLIERLDPLLRRDLVLDVTGLSKSTLYRLVKAGEFPQPVQVSLGTVGWRQSEVAAWIAGRPRAEGL